MNETKNYPNQHTNRTLSTATKMINSNYKNILEFGVAVGTSTAQLRNLLSLDYKIFAFDSFYGLPEDWFDNNILVAGKTCFTQNGTIPNIPNVTFYKGWFEETIPQYIKEHHNEPIALVHMDCDIYSSAKTALEGITPYVVKDTMFVIDDWVFQHVGNEETKKLHSQPDNVQKAFYEWALKYDKAFELFPIVDDEYFRRKIQIKN